MQSTFQDLALPLAERFGFRMIPVPVGGKAPVWKNWVLDASSDPAGIRVLQGRTNVDRRFEQWNAGCVADPTIHCCLDCDEPGLVARIELETGHTMPATFTVRSGGKGQPHFYFRPTLFSTQIGNRSTGTFDFWVTARQTVAPGSLHTSGRTYDVVDDSDLATIPEWLCEWIEKQESIWRPGKNAAGDGDAISRLAAAYRRRLEPEDMYGLPDLAIDSGQHPTMLYIAGLLHDGERDEDTIVEILTHLWREYCTGREIETNDSELVRIARHVLKGTPASLEPAELPCYIAGKVMFTTEQSMEEYLNARLRNDGSAANTSNPYPVSVWEGTLYHEFAALCTHGNFIPPEFFIEALKTVCGSILGRNLCIANVDGGVSRFDTVLIGPPSCGKNTVIGWALDVFRSRRDASPEETKYLWGAQEPCNGALGTCNTKISSASGLARFLPSVGKSQNVPQNRILLVYSELAELFEKIGIDGSGASLISAICDLYDGEEFSVPALKDQRPFGGELLMSLLGGIQPERWLDLASGRGIENSGIHSRWNLIPAGPAAGTVALLERPDLTAFRAKIIAKLPVQPYEVTIAPAARAHLGEWYADLLAKATAVGVSDLAARLNILALRNALHLAWMTGNSEIDLGSATAGTALSTYQFTVRGQYTPLVGDDQIAKYMNRMRRILEARGTLPYREFQQLVHYRRMGTKFQTAFESLVAYREVGKAGKNVVWLGGDE